MELVQLVYHSRPSIELTGSARLTAFRDIHKVAKSRNQSEGVGGFLVLTRSHFVQLLEGERNVVMATYDRISRDVRHMDCTLLDISPVRFRQFEAWAMGAVMDELKVREAALAAGISDIKDLTSLSAKQVTAVLLALAQDSRPMAA
jgi:hypothetical protein